MSRLTKLTAEVSKTILTAVREGQFLATAATLAGVHRDSVYEWVERGKNEPDSIFADFADALETAEAEFKASANLLVMSDYRANRGLAWFLERRFPALYSARVKAELTGADGGPVQTEVVARVVMMPPLDDEPEASAEAGSPVGAAPGSSNPVPGVDGG